MTPAPGDVGYAAQSSSFVLPKTSFHNGSMLRLIKGLICTPCQRPDAAGPGASGWRIPVASPLARRASAFHSLLADCCFSVSLPSWPFPSGQQRLRDSCVLREASFARVPVGGTAAARLVDVSASSPFLTVVTGESEYGDYVPSITVELKENCPVGRFEAGLKISVQDAGKVQDKIVPVAADVVETTYVEPRSVVLGGEARASCRLRLVLYDRRTKVAPIDSPPYMTTTELVRTVEDDRVVCVLQVRTVGDGSAKWSAKDRIVLHTNDARHQSLDVPVVCLATSSSATSQKSGLQ
jgi:hypothetical protein